MSLYKKELEAQAAGEKYQECDDDTIRTLIQQLSAAKEAQKSWKGVFEANKKFVLDWLASRGISGTRVGKTTVSASWHHGRRSLDRKSLERDYPEIDMAKYETVGDDYMVFEIKAKK